MKSHYILKKIVLICLSLYLVSCSTEDILPSIELALSETNLSEDNGVITLTANLNASTATQITVPLIISGSASLTSDYTLSASEIVINQNSSSGSITISGVQDIMVEGAETIVITLGNVSNVLVLSNSEFTIMVQDDDSDSDGDGVLDANDDCPDLAGDVSNNGCPFLGFLINEVLYDPESGDAGDANGDGTRDANEDEFIEFFNSGPEVDLSGYTISDASSLRHTFPTGTIVPVNGVLVLFGGGAPSGTFGGALVQTASEGQINMSNSGDLVTLADASGNIVLTFDVEPLSNNPNESYTRSPDLTGDFVQHTSVDEANGALFSPGVKLNGSSF